MQIQELRKKIYNILSNNLRYDVDVLELIQKVDSSELEIIINPIKNEVLEIVLSYDIINGEGKDMQLKSFEEVNTFLDLNEEEYEKIKQIVKLLAENYNDLTIEKEMNGIRVLLYNEEDY